MTRRTLLATLVAGLAFTASGANAACNATVNGRPMSMEICRAAWQIYGSVVPGHYLVDQAGNWVNIYNPAHRGNFYLDAQRGGGGGGGGDSGGMRRYSGGSIGGGCFYDNETGASVCP